MDDTRGPPSIKPKIAGWLTLIAAALALWNGFGALLEEDPNSSSLILSFDRYWGCGILVIALGAVAIAGAISSIYRKDLTLSLAGAACGTVGDGIVGVVLGLTAIALLFLSDMDF